MITNVDTSRITSYNVCYTKLLRFRAAYGTSPSRFRRHGQMTLARQRLLAGASLADAALAAGFADQSHFTHAFRRKHQDSPALYRRRFSG